MPDRPKVQKARITKLDPRTGALNPLQSVECHFNPNEFEIKGAIKWIQEPSIGADFPRMTFSGGDAQDMTVDFLFDTTDTGQDVRKEYATLLEIASVDKDQKNTRTKKSAPAACQFQWGRLLSFNAVIKEINQKFTLFKPDGTPLRARVSVTFSQAGEQPKWQNPTSRTDSRKTWVVTKGDRLDWIAYYEYGDPAYWRHIAEANDLDNPAELQPGQVLQLLPLP